MSKKKKSKAKGQGSSKGTGAPSAALSEDTGSADESESSDSLDAVEPVTETPAASNPDSVKTEAPKPEAPKAEAPKAEAIKTEAPKAEAAKPEAPKTEAPKAGTPPTDAPKTAPASTEEKPSKPKKEEPPLTPFQKLDSKIRYTVVLTVTCLAGVFAVLLVWSGTDSTIRQLNAEGEKVSVGQVLGVPAKDVKLVYRELRAKDGFPLDARVYGDPKGKAAYQFAVPGYAGPVKMIVGVSADTVLGLSIPGGGHNETPGLGARVDEVKASGTWWDMVVASAGLRNVAALIFLVLAGGGYWRLFVTLRERQKPLHPNIRPDLIAVSVWIALPSAALLVGFALLVSRGGFAAEETEVPRPWFQEQFSKPTRTRSTLVIKKTEELGPDYVACISGSTITTAAVTNGLLKILDVAEQVRQPALFEKFTALKSEGETEPKTP